MSDLGNREIFSKNLRYYMNKNKITQNDLINKFELSSSTVSDWCNGKKYPRIDKIEMLANFFGIEKSDLIENKEVTNEELEARALARDFIRLDNKDKNIVRNLMKTMINNQENKNENS